MEDETDFTHLLCSVCGKPARDQIAPKPEKPVGVGMRITEHAPHRVTELVPNGPAALSKKIRLQDRLVAVNGLAVQVRS